ncbi:MAG: tRNA (guanosine(46)-N7)-methyltransferase TrmB [Clostridiales bacterium]|nr:tRNA (guanosine(46)-N7)-methyltransferase TrmB [Clostridiales bacterium]
MRMRHKKWAEPELNACCYFEKSPESNKGCWRDRFENRGNPLYVELGCGKGVFTAEFGRLNRDINLLAIDIKSDVLAVARRNIENLNAQYGTKNSNIILTAYNVANIDDILDRSDCIDRIYINFCNPWPKKKHKKRRLTHPNFLNKYKSFLKPGGEIHFKTDDDELFEESLEYFRESGFEIYDICRDVHAENVDSNIITEHEIMFCNEGKPIKRCTAKYIRTDINDVSKEQA